MTIEFHSYVSADISTSEMEAAHNNLKKHPLYQAMAEYADQSGRVRIEVVDGDQVPSPEGDRIYAYTADVTSDPGFPNTDYLVRISIEFLTEVDYVSTGSTDPEKPHTFERALSHEMPHVLHRINGDTRPIAIREGESTVIENEVMKDLYSEPEKTGYDDFVPRGTPRTEVPTHLDDPQPIPPAPEDGLIPNGAQPINFTPGQDIQPGSALGGGFDPLVFDLDNSGTIDLVSVANSTAYFDFWGDGFAEKTGWVAPTDGMLSIDLDSNGEINGAAELFGSNFPLQFLLEDGFASFFDSENGFARLELYDSNSDGVIDSSDTVWNDLTIWQDVNQDGISQATELLTLDSLNIASIDVAGAALDSFLGLASGGFTRIIEGHTVTHSSTFTMTDNSTREIVDVWFENEAIDTYFNEDYTLDVRSLYLPTARGYGNMSDLHVAASIDNGTGGLIDDLIAFATTRDFDDLFDDFDTVKSDVRNILMRWAGVDENTPVSYIEHGVFGAIPEYQFLKTFTGQNPEFTGTWFDGTPFLPYISDGIEAVYQSFENVLNGYSARLVFQSSGNELFESGASYNVFTDEFSSGLRLLETAIDDLETEATTHGDKEGFWRNVATFIENSMGLSEINATETTWLAAAVTNSSSSALTWAGIIAALDINVIDGTSGNETLTGTDYDDVINGFEGDDTLIGGAGNDHLNGNLSQLDAGNDILDGGLGNDILNGGRGDDVYHYSSGNDIIVEAGGNYASDTDIIIMDSSISVADVSLHRARLDKAVTDHFFFEIEGKGTLTIQNDSDYWTDITELVDEVHFSGGTILNVPEMDVTIHGTSGDDNINHSATFLNNIVTIYGYDGDDVLEHNGVSDAYIFGGEGDDILRGSSSGLHTLDGGAGNDALFGSTGNDTFIMSEGIDVIIDTSGSDIIKLPEGYTISDVEMYRISLNGNFNTFYDLELIVDGLGTIFVDDHFNNPIETLEFFNGSTLDLLQLDYIVKGTAGDDTFNTVSNPWVSQDDTYLFGLGNDVIGEWGGVDTILFEPGIELSDLTIHKIDSLPNSIYAGNLIIYDNAGNSMAVSRGFGDSMRNVENLEFDDGTIVQISSLEIESHGSEGNDSMTGIEGEDLTLADTMFGYGGNDNMNGGSGDDILNGGAGDDQVGGGSGFDISVYSGAFSNYTITPFSSHYDVEDIVGSDGKDYVWNVERLEFLDGYYDFSNTTFTLYDQVFVATAAAESFIADDYGVDTVDFSNSTTAVNVDIKDNILSGGFAAGDSVSKIDAVIGSDYDDLLKGDNGINMLDGGIGNDDLYGRDGDDEIHGGAGVDKIRGGDGNDNIYAGDDNDTDVRGEAGDDTIYGEDGDDKIQGSEGNDTLLGGLGADEIYGDDTSYTLTGNDTLDGGAGDDSLRGGLGDDTYIFSSGADDIYDVGGVDTLQFGAGYDLIDLDIQIKSGDNYSLILTSGSDTLELSKQLEAVTVIENVIFDDGSYANLGDWLNWKYISGGLETGSTLSDTIIADVNSSVTFNGLEGNDTLFGNDSNDHLRGGQGDDLLHGGAGTDTAYFTGVYSNYDISGNTIEDLVGSEGKDTLISIERLEFYDGYYESGTFTASSTDDSFTATAAIEVFDGASGSDTVDYSNSTYGVSVDLLNATASGGFAKGDILVSIENLTGSANVDTLGGDSNDNTLAGGLGADTYIYRGGLDTITDTGGVDTLILSNALVSDVSFAFDSDDLVITINSGTDEIRITDHAIAASTIETIQFSDGFSADLSDPTSWINSNDTVTYVGGTSASDVIILGDLANEGKGLDGNDYIYGDDGDDTLRGGDGIDVLYGANGIDKILGGLGNDVIDAGAGDDIDVRGQEGDDVIFGGAGNDKIYGDYNSSDTMAGNDTLDGGIGNDELRGGLGNDIYIASSGDDYIYDRGGYDVIRFGEGISIFDLTFAADPTDGNDQIITINGVDTIHIENQTNSSGVYTDYTIEELQFFDGSYANFANILDWDFALVGGGTIQGSYSLGDTMIGKAGDDNFLGKDENDQLFGGAGNDSLKGNNGDDLLVAGSGADRMEGHDGADTFLLSGIETIDGNLNRVVDFDATENDTIVLADILENYDPLTDSISDFIQMSTTSHTYLDIDIDGKGVNHSFVEDVIRVEGINTWTDVDDMITQGHLLVA